MKERPEDRTPGASPRGGVLLGIAAIAALAAAVLLGVLLAIRPISSLDLGYHLAYGEEFLDHGKWVDSNRFIYTIDGPAAHGSDDVGPGCWYDSQGRYHFPNANWLTQVLLSAVHRTWGADGLCVLQASLVAGTFALVLVAMWRLGLPPALMAAGALIMALGGYPRFSLRPELVSYLVLAGQLAILVGERPGWPAAAALVVLQLLFANLHSFYVLGLAFTGAFLAEALLRLGWQRLARAPADDAARALTRRVLVLACALVGQAAVCFVNPWTWRIVVLPAQTLLFMRQHKVGQPGASTHSWARIGELYRTLTPDVFASAKASVTHWVLLGLTGVAALAAIARRRWAWLLLMGGLTMASLSVRRNIALAPLLATPIVLAAIWGPFERATGRIPPGPRRGLAWAAVTVLLVASVWFVGTVVTQRFYYDERLPYRLGSGFARTVIPDAITEWINAEQPAGPIWTDFDNSSNVHYFTRPHRDVPVVTNTWAQPPSIIGDVMDYCQGRKDFARVQRQYAPQVVVLGAGPNNQPLLRRLAKDTAWAMTVLDATQVVFVRLDGPNAALAQRSRISPESLDLAAYKKHLAGLDPLPAYSTYLGGLTLYYLGWTEQAIQIVRASLDLDDRYGRAWNTLGICFAARGTDRLVLRDIINGRADLREAVRCFRTAGELDDLPEARKNLALAQNQLAQLERGIILKPQY